MIRWQPSIRSLGVRNMEGAQGAKEVTDYVNGKQPNYKVQAFSSRFGDVNMLVWQIDFEDLGGPRPFQSPRCLLERFITLRFKLGDD